MDSSHDTVSSHIVESVRTDCEWSIHSRGTMVFCCVVYVQLMYVCDAREWQCAMYISYCYIM